MPTIQDIMAKKAEFQKELTEYGKAALSERFKKVFDAHPDLLAIRWRQYTPYFNDGSPCRFGVHDFYTRLNDTPDDAGDDGDGFDWQDGPIGDAIYGLSRIDRDVYLAVFGDHCQVTATREGFDVEEYEHG